MNTCITVSDYGGVDVSLSKEERLFAERKFEELSRLWRDDPEEFGRVARMRIDKLIESVEPERRQSLRQLQFRIDCELRKYKDPVARMNKMTELFWEGVKSLDDALNGKLARVEEKTIKKKAPHNVLKFKGRKKLNK